LETVLRKLDIHDVDATRLLPRVRETSRALRRALTPSELTALASAVAACAA
jgi:hypothetical protein